MFADVKRRARDQQLRNTLRGTVFELMPPGRGGAAVVLGTRRRLYWCCAVLVPGPWWSAGRHTIRHLV